MRTIQNGISDQWDRFHGWMELEQITFLSHPREGIHARISPKVRTVAAKLAELNVVNVGALPVFENKYQLVLAAVKRAHSGVILSPDTNVFQFGIDLLSCLSQFAEVAPVHENVMKTPILTVSRKKIQ